MRIPRRQPQAAAARLQSKLRGNVRRLITKHPRRRLLRLAAGAVALPAISRIAWAQAYPTRPVRIVVAYPAGGALDTFARIIGQSLSERFSQPFVIENRPGAGGNIGTEAVVRAPPDGYTLLLVDTSSAINATLYDKLNFNFLRDIAPVASIVRAPQIMLVTPSFPAKSIPDFIAYAKASPGKINMASAGNGSSGHVAGELFNMMSGVHMVHVPYRGGAPALTDLLGGQVQVMFNSPVLSIEYVKSGKLRALAVTAATRSEVLPEIPTIGEFVPGYEASVFYGLGTPKGTPANIIDKLNKEINLILTDPKIKARIAELGATVFASSSGDFGNFMATQTEKWAKVVKFSGAKAE